MSENLHDEQTSLTIDEFRRGQLACLDVLAKHFEELMTAGRKYYTSEQLISMMKSIKYNLEVVTD